MQNTNKMFCALRKKVGTSSFKLKQETEHFHWGYENIHKTS